jgi:HD-GYP domain-containing protein (c-di-GMP phosphodiesterase class II)
MPGDRSTAGVRAAEVIAALSLATDLGTGQPLERGLVATLASCRLCDRLGVDEATTAETYYTCLLMFVGCTADAPAAAEVYVADLHDQVLPVMYGGRAERIRGVVTAVAPPTVPLRRRVARLAAVAPRALASAGEHAISSCEVGRMLAVRLGLPTPIPELLGAVSERWGGGGPLDLAGEEIPLPVRIAQLVRDAIYQQADGGGDHAQEVLRSRAGKAFDPRLVDELLAGWPEVVDAEIDGSVWHDVIDRNPRDIVLVGDEIDQALGAIGDFTDLLSPRLTGHSAYVADLAGAAASDCGLNPDDVALVRRSGWIHDVGRVAVAPRIWNKAGPLNPDEWEQARLHPYYTERVLDRSPFLHELSVVAAAHHERLDGSGYYRGTTAAGLSRPARILAAADAFRSALEPEAGQPACSLDEAALRLTADVEAGRLDADAVAAVVAAAGLERPALPRPCDLTDREVQVVTLLAQGMLTKQVARALGISPKTADRHLQNAYQKIGISSRSALTLFAMEHGLVSWGELPMGASGPRP